MAFTTYFLCIAFLCVAKANPLGQTGYGYDYSSLPLPMQNVGSTTYCETTPNVYGLGIGYPCPVNYGYLPSSYPSYPRYPVSYPINDNIGYYPYPNIQVPTTTVCETTPNVVGILPRPNVPVPNVGSTTVCETTPNVVGFLPYPNLSVPNVATTVCETTPNVLPVNPCISPLSYPGLLSGYSSYGMPFL